MLFWSSDPYWRGLFECHKPFSRMARPYPIKQGRAACLLEIAAFYAFGETLRYSKPSLGSFARRSQHQPPSEASKEFGWESLRCKADPNFLHLLGRVTSFTCVAKVTVVTLIWFCRQCVPYALTIRRCLRFSRIFLAYLGVYSVAVNILMLST